MMDFSIIIPCRNEELFIKSCIESVLRFNAIDGEYEILVIDGMSTDGTREIIEELKKKNTNLFLFDNPHKIVPTGLNIGIRKAKGDFILRLDAHSHYSANYLRLCLNTIKRTGADNVGGLFISEIKKDTLEAKLIQALTTHRFGVGNAGYRLGSLEGNADTVPYGCFRKDIFNKIGLFDERLVRNQDYEFNRRIIASGGKNWRNPEIEIFYHNKDTILGLLHQAEFTGQWNPWMWYLAPYSFSPRHIIPGLFLIGLLFALALMLFSNIGSVILLAILIPYSLIAITASIEQSKRYSWDLFIFMPFLFFTYHATYGWGIVKGIIKLIFRRAPIFCQKEPWSGAGQYRAWPPQAKLE